MAIFYPTEYGSYSCDLCGDSAEHLGFPPMWRCADGCDYDVCEACHDVCGLGEGEGVARRPGPVVAVA